MTVTRKQTARRTRTRCSACHTVEILVFAADLYAASGVARCSDCTAKHGAAGAPCEDAPLTRARKSEITRLAAEAETHAPIAAETCIADALAAHASAAPQDEAAKAAAKWERNTDWADAWAAEACAIPTTSANVPDAAEADAFYAMIQTRAAARKAQAKPARTPRVTKAERQMALMMEQYERDVAANPNGVVYNPGTRNFDLRRRGALASSHGSYIEAERARLALVTRDADGVVAEDVPPAELTAEEIQAREEELTTAWGEAQWDYGQNSVGAEEAWAALADFRREHRIALCSRGGCVYSGRALECPRCAVEYPTGLLSAEEMDAHSDALPLPAEDPAVSPGYVIDKMREAIEWGKTVRIVPRKPITPDPADDTPPAVPVGQVVSVPGGDTWAVSELAPKALPTCATCGRACAVHGDDWCGCIPAVAPYAGNVAFYDRPTDCDTCIGPCWCGARQPVNADDWQPGCPNYARGVLCPEETRDCCDECADGIPPLPFTPTPAENRAALDEATAELLLIEQMAGVVDVEPVADDDQVVRRLAA